MNPLLPAVKALKPSLLPFEAQNGTKASEGLSPHSKALSEAEKVNMDNPENWDDRWFADYE